MVTRATSHSTDGDTRRRVTRLLLERGHATAADLARDLGITATATRRHLDAMEAEGQVETRVVKTAGRGRPARSYQLTPAARTSFGHTYDDLAMEALRWIRRFEGEGAVSGFAAEQVARLEARCRAAMDAVDSDDPMARAQALATAMSSEGYAATASVIASGGQICQHHCPVAGVAAEFPQLCEAETRVMSRLLGVHVQRLATIANGDGVCTTHVPGKSGPRAAHGAGGRGPVPLPAPERAQTDNPTGRR
ncbi:MULTISPECIES: helix-turn-helix transcriptional regulator [Glycomyces]|uniref:Transcriptional regulator n=1 Tax=Glycomyces artemisiae TaxID=1076443 RepID=A0A2T0UKU8_9ACTN|nr:metalloregulator ArsR/SmtB family transcription factor [Glycomyces artemisiae]NUQ88006.1 transcriptional regulator [Glycomyces artemisiae]PRY58516.1 ArsR family transcriptional regulator [Glycomyces artemisiae]